MLAALARYSLSYRILARILRHAATLEDGECAALVRETRRQWRITRPVLLVTTTYVDVPVTYGILAPRILLPQDVSEWSRQRCRYVLHHELAHVKRLDACTQLVAQLASAIFWFHPLIWYVIRQMRLERERACDDYVLAAGAVASDYADHLLAIVNTRGFTADYPAALAFARRSQFEKRLVALLDPRVKRGVLTGRSVFCIAIAAIALTMPFAAARGIEFRKSEPVKAMLSAK